MCGAARLDAMRRYLAVAAHDRDRPAGAETTAAAAVAGKRGSATVALQCSLPLQLI